MDITIRLEQKADYRAVEEITRAAFWNLHVPGADEHYLTHCIRNSPDFIPELDFVALFDGYVTGNIIYTRSKILCDNGSILKTITFGPLCVLPELHGQGIGSALVKHSLKTAAQMEFSAVLIYGNPAYYGRFGFVGAKKYGISRADGRFPKALQVLPLQQMALNGITGRFYESEDFFPPEDAFAAFDRTFPYKAKVATQSQREFEVIANSFE